jgi:hypothetical protein
MSKFKKPVMLYNKKQWQQYQKEILSELNANRNSNSFSVQLPKSPESYPCLIYTAPVFANSKSDEGSALITEIACYYIYTDDADELLRTIGSDNLLDFFSSFESKLSDENKSHVCHNYAGPQGELGEEGRNEEDNDVEEEEEIIFDDDEYHPMENSFNEDNEKLKNKQSNIKDYVPASAGVLLLTLVSELRSIGALKLDRMMETAKEVEQWMIDHQEENLHSDLWELLKRLWDKKDVS